MDITLTVANQNFTLVETVAYPNGGTSGFYIHDHDVIILDDGICNRDSSNIAFPYVLITDKQNYYMKNYERVYRFLIEDKDTISDFLSNPIESYASDYTIVANREDGTDSSPLEFYFERMFSNVYGTNALKYLRKEYSITGRHGRNYFLDYLVRTTYGDIAVEENGVSFHHPQIIGKEKYRRQLEKQNTCTKWGIRLFRFSTEDCRFEERVGDDIISFFGNNADAFIEDGIMADREVRLYDHQILTLEEIKERRRQGIHTFLAVFPTASGKSKIVEEDLQEYFAENPDARVLIMAPNTNIVNDWKTRIAVSLSRFTERIDVHTNAYMAIHYHNIHPDYYDYVVIDEAHHAVAPTAKRVIQHFTPDFLIGLTATDERMDKKRLETVFGSYKTTLTLREAMEKKIVAEANVFRIETNLDLSKVRFNGKDYVNADLEKSIRVTSRNELIADVLKKYFCANGMENLQGVVFCVNVKHCQEMEKILNRAGISAAAYTGQQANTGIMDDFKQKKIRFLCACNMISEGWDYPELGILVMARPTMSKVLYLQQIGRGLRRTESKDHMFVVDVVDEYGAVVKPCSMHSIFSCNAYVPFGSILKRDYQIGDIIEVDGLVERVERIIPVDTETFEEKYGNYLNQEQVAREFFMSTGSIISWVKKGRIQPDQTLNFGSKKIYLFSPEHVAEMKAENNIPDHNDDTIRKDFFDFLAERDYSLSYKMPFLLAFIKNLNSVGDASIDSVLKDYVAFYQDRVEKGLPVDRKTCPYTEETLKDDKFIKRNMLTNPFEKFERKRFMYYSKELGTLSMNHALFGALSEDDFEVVRVQMREDLDDYYRKLS